MKPSLAISAVVLLVLVLLVPTASAYTGPWSIQLFDKTGQLIGPNGIDGGSNVTIRVTVGSTIAAGARYLVGVSSGTNVSVPLIRRPLGYFDSNYNSSRTINYTLSLSTYSTVINPHGDYIHLWVERLGGAIEADAGIVTIKADFDQLIQNQQNFFFGYITTVQQSFNNQMAQTQYQIAMLQNYVIALALLVIFIGIFSARDVLRKQSKTVKNAEATRTAIDAWLKAYIADRMGRADVAQEEVDKATAPQEGAAKNGT